MYVIICMSVAFFPRHNPASPCGGKEHFYVTCMIVKCYAVGCTSSYTNKAVLFGFPKDAKRCKDSSHQLQLFCTLGGFAATCFSPYTRSDHQADKVLKEVNGEYINFCNRDEAMNILCNARDLVMLTVKHYRTATRFLPKYPTDGGICDTLHI